MPYIITQPCIGVCDTACIPVCPVDCIHGPLSVEEIEEIKEEHGENAKQLSGIQMYIDPDVCIDCGACEPECPVEAIFDEDEVPEKWEADIEANYKFFRT